MRGPEHLVEVEEGIDVDVGVEARRLRTERAVLGARAGLAVDQALELDLGTAIFEPHAMGERYERRKFVERERCDRQHFVSSERAALVEQGTLGAVEGIMHARQATRSRFGGLALGSQLRGSAHLLAATAPPWRGRHPQQVGVLPLGQHARREAGKIAPRALPENAGFPVGCSRIRMATVDRPTRAATRMSVATLASRGIGFVRVWVDRRGARHHVPRKRVPVVELGLQCALRAARGGRARPPCSCRRFVHLLDAGEDREAEDLASGLLGLALVVMGVVCVAGVIAAPQIARLLSSGVHDPQIEQQQIALTTFLLRFFIPQVSALRARNRRHRDPLRQAPFRDHRDRTDREHRVRRRGAVGVPRGGRRPIRVSISHSKRS